jgi:hypothetical protein
VPPDLTGVRFNVGVRTLFEGAKLRIELYNREGHLEKTAERFYPPSYFEQQSAAVFLETNPPPGGAIHLVVAEGSAIVYATSTDNVSNDATMQVASVVEEFAMFP